MDNDDVAGGFPYVSKSSSEVQECFMGGPWSPKQIDIARRVKFGAVLDHLGAYYKLDKSYAALDPARHSIRVHVNYACRDFRFILTDEKWLNELFPPGHQGRGGGGAIDFVQHLTGLGFVPAVKVCLDAAESGEQQ